MIKINIECKWKDSIIYNYIPKFIYKLLKDRIKENKNQDLYLKKYYNISLEELINGFYKNIKWDKYGNSNYIIYLDNNAYYKHYRLATLVDIINYGDFKIKGNNLFNNVFNYVNNNLSLIHDFYMMTETD